ncbi:MAG: hypothetical protein U9R60_05260 [Bacteroidota bacterium]|nr:hypothetical protein [Bacteroidota bacterium]
MARMEFATYQRDKLKALTDVQIKEIGEMLIAYTNSGLKLDDRYMDKVNGRFCFRGDDKGDSTANFDIDPVGGSFIFNKEIEGYYGEENTKGLPDEYYATILSEKHLEELGLLPEDFRENMTLVHLGGLRMATVGKDGLSAEYDKMVTVTYGRKLDGICVKGASRIVVNMGNYGELAGLVWNWPKLERKEVLAKNIIAPKNRRHQIGQQLQSLYANSNVESISINEVKIVLYDDGKGDIEPAMFVLGEVTQEDGFVYLGDWILPLLKSPKATYTVSQRLHVYPGSEEDLRSGFVVDSCGDDDDNE